MQNKLMRLLIIFAGVGIAFYLYYYGATPYIVTGQITTVTKSALELSYRDSWLDTTSGFDCSTTPVAPLFDSVECLLRLVDPQDRTNINILRYTTTLPITVDMIQEMFSSSGGELVALEVIDMNGTPAVEAEMSIAPSGNHVRQLSTYFDGGLYVITAFAVDRATFYIHRVEIDNVLSSIKASDS
jgi:hypothetical protein